MEPIKSMRDALWAIANMQITEHTNHKEVLALVISIAKIELEKLELGIKLIIGCKVITINAKHLIY